MPKTKNHHLPRYRPGSRKTAAWQLQAAKAQFSELFRRAQAEGPQYVTRQGRDAVVVVKAQEFERLKARSSQPGNLVRFFSESPLAQAGLDFERTRDYGRKVVL